MEIYVVQKAIQALDALSGEGSLKERLAEAWVHLGGYSDDHWLQDAQDVKEAYRHAFEVRDAGSLADEAAALSSIIIRIFIERGYEKAASELNCG